MERETLLQEARSLVHLHYTVKNENVNRVARRLSLQSHVLMALMGGLDSPHLTEEVLLTIINGLSAPANNFKKVATANYEAIQEICRNAQRRHRLVGVIGYPGAGKTVALDSYYRNSRNTYYIEAKKCMNRKQFFSELLVRLGVSFTGTMFEMLNACAAELNSKQNPLLIIDEAGKLDLRIHIDLHDLRNATMNNAGIVLAGVDYLRNDLRKAALKQKQGFPEWYSRIQTWHELEKPTRTEIVNICRANGVEDELAIKNFRTVPNFRELYNGIENWKDEQEVKSN